MYEVTFLNGNEKLKEKGLETLRSVKEDLEFLLFYRNYNLKKILKKLDNFGHEISLENYYLDNLEELKDDIDLAVEECLDNYGLGFDYVEGHTDYNPNEGYWRFQIAWGGPSYEVRFHKNNLIEFVYLDWFVGVGFDVSNDKVFQELKNYFEDLGLFETAEREAKEN